ncbi:RNA polymerase sigma factor [Amycolatopsis aidingensis]|uniref:RNA polymerase sigma factor n=1 Tax=Amycolatopsis aidingensis TaxID=2842453 RepID=UPI0038CBF807
MSLSFRFVLVCVVVQIAGVGGAAWEGAPATSGVATNMERVLVSMSGGRSSGTVQVERGGPGLDEQSEVSDRMLWREVSAGSHAAFREFFHRHLRAVWNHAYRLTGSADVAEDLASITFLTAWRKRAQVVLVHDSALPWLFTIAGNAARDERRSTARRDRLVRRMRSGVAVPDHAEAVASQMDDQDRGRRLAEAVGRLPAAQRRVVELCLLGELPQSEVAAVLGVTEMTVRSNLARARARLRTMVKRAGSDDCA